MKLPLWRGCTYLLLFLWTQKCGMLDSESQIFEDRVPACWCSYLWWNRMSLVLNLPGASVRNSTHGKGHEEGGLAYANAWSSLRKPAVPKHLPPKPGSAYFTVSCSHLYLWLYGGLNPITSLGEGVSLQLQVNKNSWAWRECFNLRTPLKVI